MSATGSRLNSSSFEAVDGSSLTSPGGGGSGIGGGAGGGAGHASAFTFRVVVRAVSAHKLPKTDFLGRPDPFVLFNLAGRRFETPTLKNQYDPSWDDWYNNFYYAAGSLEELAAQTFRLECWDSKASKTDDHFIGFWEANLMDIATGPTHHEHTLLRKDGSPHKKGRALVSFEIIMELERIASVTLKNVHCINLRPVNPEPAQSSPGAGTMGALKKNKNQLTASFSAFPTEQWKNDCYLQVHVQGQAHPPKASYVCFDAFDPFWGDPNITLDLHGCLSDLLKCRLILEVYHTPGPQLRPEFLGGVSLEISQYHCFQSGTPIVFRTEITDKMHSSSSTQAMLEGVLYFNNMPNLSQLVEGQWKENEILNGVPLLEGLPLPPNVPVKQLGAPVYSQKSAVSKEYSSKNVIKDYTAFLHGQLSELLERFGSRKVKKIITSDGRTMSELLRAASFSRPASFSLRGGLQAAMSLLRAAAKFPDQTLCAAIAKIIHQLVLQDRKVTQELFRVVGGIPITLRLLSATYIKCLPSEVVQNLAEIISLIALRDSANQEAVRDSGGISVLVSLLTLEQVCLTAKRFAVQALANLCYLAGGLNAVGEGESNRDVIRYAGGLRALAQVLAPLILEQGPEVVVLHRTLLHTIEFLCRRDMNAIHFLGFLDSLLFSPELATRTWALEFLYTQMKNASTPTEVQEVVGSVGFSNLVRLIATSHAKSRRHALFIFTRATADPEAPLNALKNNQISVADYLALIGPADMRSSSTEEHNQVISSAINVLKLTTSNSDVVLELCYAGGVQHLCDCLPLLNSLSDRIAILELLRRVASYSVTSEYFVTISLVDLLDYVQGQSNENEQIAVLEFVRVVLELEGRKRRENVSKFMALLLPIIQATVSATVRRLCVELVDSLIYSPEDDLTKNKTAAAALGVLQILLPFYQREIRSSAEALIVFQIAHVFFHLKDTKPGQEFLKQHHKVLMQYSKNHIRSPLKTHTLVEGVGKMLNSLGYTTAMDVNGDFIKIPSREEKEEELKAKRRAQVELETTRQEAEAAKQVAEEKEIECIVCYEPLQDVVLYKCGHICVCMDCGKMLKEGKQPCPICRKPILDVVKYFYA